VPVLAKKYRVLTLDLPGHGQSGAPKDGKFSMDLFARAVEAVRAEAGTDKIVLVGHSMGAPVIRQYARLYPQHVAALVAVDGPLDMRQFPADFKPPSLAGPEGLKAREGMIKGMFTPQTPADVQQKVLAMMLKAPEATAIGAMMSITDPSLRKTDVTPMPALAVWAGTNQQLPNVDETRRRCGNSRRRWPHRTVTMEKPGVQPLARRVRRQAGVERRHDGKVAIVFGVLVVVRSHRARQSGHIARYRTGGCHAGGALRRGRRPALHRRGALAGGLGLSDAENRARGGSVRGAGRHRDSDLRRVSVASRARLANPSGAGAHARRCAVGDGRGYLHPLRNRSDPPLRSIPGRPPLNTERRAL
jgi:pimeloyl-ACP methyl ester carboxylesterase